ncbi:MAG: DUF1850 domain-containing protein [Clostridia bacterium]|nr:DUF1850 domain-containing protein [Clostridia bacterium]
MRHWLILPITITLLTALACCPTGQRVVLIDREGEILYSAHVPEGEYVWLLYTHSFNKGLVEDGYELVDGKIILRSTRVRQYGAGIPEPEPGQVFSVHDGYYQIDGFDIELDTQWTFVGRIADHRLRVGEDGEIVHYDQLASPGTPVGLKADNWSVAKQFLWRLGKFAG